MQRMTDGYGRPCFESYAKLTPDGYWSRMLSGFCQLTLDGSLAECSETWPRSGFVCDGIAYRQPPLVRRISAIGSGFLPTITQPYGTGQNGQRPDGSTFKGAGAPSLHTMARKNMWPTPLKSDATGGPRKPDGKRGQNLRDMTGPNPTLQMWPTPTAGDSKASGSRNLEGSKAHAGVSLTDAVRYGNSNTPRWATPRASDHRSGRVSAATLAKNSRPLCEQAGGLLNPTWVEWLMGLPIGWTDLKHLGTASSHLLPRPTED